MGICSSGSDESGCFEVAEGSVDVLMDMGVDGFKLDAGDPCYYHAGDKLFRDASTDELSRLWLSLGNSLCLMS